MSLLMRRCRRVTAVTPVSLLVIKQTSPGSRCRVVWHQGHLLAMLLLVLLGLAALCQVPSPAAASKLGDNIAMFEGAAVEDTAEVAAVEDTADFHVDATNETEFAFLLEHNDQLFDPSLLVPLKRSVPLITISDVKDIVLDQDGNNITHVEGTEKQA